MLNKICQACLLRRLGSHSHAFLHLSLLFHMDCVQTKHDLTVPNNTILFGGEIPASVGFYRGTKPFDSNIFLLAKIFDVHAIRKA